MTIHTEPDRKTGPSVNRHRSRQDYETPQEFIDAVEKRFGCLIWDLACDGTNNKAANFYTPHDDSLAQVWNENAGNLWLNPPFANIAPWAKKCDEESAKGAKILLLVPASVDSYWWANYVHHKAVVLFLSPRLCFDGKNPYPKPCALCFYGYSRVDWYETWRWK